MENEYFLRSVLNKLKYTPERWKYHPKSKSYEITLGDFKIFLSPSRRNQGVNQDRLNRRDGYDGRNHRLRVLFENKQVLEWCSQPNSDLESTSDLVDNLYINLREHLMGELAFQKRKKQMAPLRGERVGKSLQKLDELLG